MRWAQQGYLSVLTLPVLAMLLVLLLGAINQSTNLQQRWQLQTTADNMAMSAATMMAREVNLLAVLNRARLANQLTMAQLIGISSWYSMVSSATTRTATVTSIVPYLNVVTAQINRVVKTLEKPLKGMINTAIYSQRLIANLITATQTAVRISFASLIPTTLAELATKHGLTDEPWMLLAGNGMVEFPWLWWVFILPHSSARDNDLLKNLMLESRDPFTIKRSRKWFDFGLVKAERAGGTELRVSSAGRWDWHAMDTLSLHQRVLFGRSEVPWGESAETLGGRIKDYSRRDFGGSGGINSRASRWAKDNQRQLGSSIGSIHYYNRKHLLPAQWPSVIVRFKGVVAKAGLRYSRPSLLLPRADKKQEKANLFNALWEPELQSLSSFQKIILSQFNHVE
jgi:hypothetical protein